MAGKKPRVDDSDARSTTSSAAPAESEHHGLGRRAARGAAVSLSGQAVRTLIQIASVIVLARMLTPRDYGLVAMVAAVIGVAEIFRDFGLSTAAIQSLHLTRGQRDTLFWINTAIGALLTVVVYFCAPVVAAVYGQPDLVPIAQTLSVTFLLSGATTQYKVSLIRALRFMNLAVIEICAALLGLILAVVLAARGAGYWALVGQQLLWYTVLLTGTAIAARWLPGHPRRRTGIGAMVRFGGTMMGTQLIGYASNNVDSLILGLREGASVLGLYNRAFQLVMMPFNQIRAPITQVALPVFSRLQSSPERFDAYLLRGQLGLGYTLGLGMAVVAGASVPVTELLLGQRWSGIAPLVSCLAVATIFQTLAYVAYWVYVSRALTGQLLKYSILSATIRITCVLIGSEAGVLGVALGYALAPAIAWPLSLWWLSRCTPVPTAALYAGAGRVLVLCLIGGGASWGLTLLTDSWPAAVALTVIVPGALVSTSTLLLLRLYRTDLAAIRHTLSLVRQRA